MERDAALKAPKQTREMDMSKSSTQKTDTVEEPRCAPQEPPCPQPRPSNTGAAADGDPFNSDDTDNTVPELDLERKRDLRKVLHWAKDKGWKEEEGKSTEKQPVGKERKTDKQDYTLADVAAVIF